MTNWGSHSLEVVREGFWVTPQIWTGDEQEGKPAMEQISATARAESCRTAMWKKDI
jgi:hypothetical protein